MSNVMTTEEIVIVENDKPLTHHYILLMDQEPITKL